MHQIRIDDLLLRPRLRWVNPTDRPVLKLRAMDARVVVLYDRYAGDASRRSARQTSLAFLREHHYMHRAPDAPAPTFTWTFGLLLGGELAGLIAMNPPAFGLANQLYRDARDGATPWHRRVIAVTRTACDPAAPFNSESFLVAGALRLLSALDGDFTTVVAQADRSVVDSVGRHHVGTLYQGANGWLVRRTARPQGWRAFLNPETGARISRKCGARTRDRTECPPGWVVEAGAPLNTYLWWVGERQHQAQAALHAGVQVAIREGAFAPVWRRPVEVRPGTPRAYDPGDKELRAQETQVG